VAIIRPIISYLLIYVLFTHKGADGIVASGLGVYGAWVALACDQILRTALVFARYQSGKWKTIKLKTEK
ncbi:MAG: hypothetical protein IIU67_00050, partial [Lachnospiraceae bacterium]|nr:hypothetical protein [Lachnospiraceae bacterium]